MIFCVGLQEAINLRVTGLGVVRGKESLRILCHLLKKTAVSKRMVVQNGRAARVARDDFHPCTPI